MKTITKKLCLMSVCAVLHPMLTMAQNDLILNGQDDAYRQAIVPALMGHYQNNTIFANGKLVENLRGGKLLSSGKAVKSLAVSPAGGSFAVVREKVKNVDVYDLWRSGRKLGSAKMKNVPVACSYTADGTRLVVADKDGNLLLFRLNDFRLSDIVILHAPVSRLVAGSTMMAAFNENQVFVVDVNSKSVLAQLSASGVTDVNFSEGGQEVAVLTNDGQMTIYDTRTFSPKKTITALGEGRAMDYHPMGKYVSVVTGDQRIALLNLIDETERLYVDTEGSGVTDAFFVKDERGAYYLVYNTTDAVHYKMMNELPPYLTKLLDDEVQARMEQWERRMPEETDEQYMMRVNDETRAAQMRLFEEEVATRMALSMDVPAASQMTLGNYNPETRQMTLDLEGMPTIYIDVPREELRYFMKPDDIELRNPIYGVGKNDKFELLYADVYNKHTGKTYTFNNRERKSLEFLGEDNRFLPLEVAQQGLKDEMALDEMKNEVVSTAKTDKKLTDHTKINVSTKTLTETDADGRRHVNYQVSFDYSVDAEFSAREDFAPGHYKAEQSAAAQTMLSIINQAMQKDFARYAQPGKKVKVVIKGSADAAPIKRTLPYGGEYGDFTEEPIFSNGEQTYVTVSKKSGISDNEQLAFLRAMGMKDAIKKGVKVMEQMNVDYVTHVEQAEGIGGEFRRIFVDFIFEDAF